MGEVSHEISKLSVQDVMEMDPARIFKLAQRSGVSLAGCNHVNQFRERVVLHVQMLKSTCFDIQREFGMRHSESLDIIRQTLDQLFDEVQVAMTGLETTLEKVLIESSGGDRNVSLVQQIQARRKCLMTSQCSVVVAGETNAGKSTFLNLLLGMNILPISIFSCTAAICVLNYSDNFSAEIVYRNGHKERQTFQQVDETRDWLTNTVAEKDLEKRERGLDVEVINVHLPAVVLQSGVTLVDTPGIGENEAMYNCTMNYVKSNNAAAYIYVIKTDNAGGVHDDRILEFLRAILEHKARDTISEGFEPSSAMFVCNRWDQVPEEQREGVLENALNKLKDVWPGFQNRQAFFVSATNAQIHFNANPAYITEDYEEVLKGIKEIFGKARHNAVNQHYRWIKNLLQHSTDFLQTTIHHCSQSDDELIERFRSTKVKLDSLHQRTTETTQKLRHGVEKEMRKLCEAVAQFLQNERVKNELLYWEAHQVPSQPRLDSKSITSWQEEVDMLIMRRIMDKVDAGLKTLGLDRQLHETLKLEAQKELKLVDEEIDSIMVDMTDRSSLDSSVSSDGSSFSTDCDDAVVMVKIYKERDGFRFSNLKNVVRITEASGGSSTTPEATVVSVPKVIISKLLGPVLAVMSTLKQFRRISSYGSEPLQFMKSRTDKIVKIVTDEHKFLRQMTTKYHEKLDSFITDVENSIPRFIASNKQLMEDIRTNRRTYLMRRRELIGMMERLEPIRNLLRGFGSLYIRDVTADNVCFMLDAEQRRQSVAVSVHRRRSALPQNDSGLGASQDLAQNNAAASTPFSSQGLWSTYRCGQLAIGEDKQEVIGRSYIQPLNDNVLISEIARLRCLRCPHLAPFLGMSRMEDTAVFLFLGDTMSARRHLIKGFHEPRVSVPQILEGVLKGIIYLHHEGLVHMELTLDTIMVNRQGDPKLCGACLPRKARFPPDADMVDAEPFVCLSPEVLRGELYTSEDDCYSFGLVVWETCLREKPFDEQSRRLSLADFRRQVHPSSMLKLDCSDTLSQNLSTILRGCLLPARGLRIKMDDLQAKVSTLRLTGDFSKWQDIQQTMTGHSAQGLDFSEDIEVRP